MSIQVVNAFLASGALEPRDWPAADARSTLWRSAALRQRYHSDQLLWSTVPASPQICLIDRNPSRRALLARILTTAGISTVPFATMPNRQDPSSHLVVIGNSQRLPHNYTTHITQLSRFKLLHIYVDSRAKTLTWTATINNIIYDGLDHGPTWLAPMIGRAMFLLRLCAWRIIWFLMCDYERPASESRHPIATALKADASDDRLFDQLSSPINFGNFPGTNGRIVHPSRTLAARPILTALATACWGAAGIYRNSKGEQPPKRICPSAGNLGSPSVYVTLPTANGASFACYRYSPEQHEIKHVTFRSHHFSPYPVGRLLARVSPPAVAVAQRHYVLSRKYGPSSRRLSLLDCGVAAASSALLLAAQGIDTNLDFSGASDGLVGLTIPRVQPRRHIIPETRHPALDADVLLRRSSVRRFAPADTTTLQRRLRRALSLLTRLRNFLPRPPWLRLIVATAPSIALRSSLPVAYLAPRGWAAPFIDRFCHTAPIQFVLYVRRTVLNEPHRRSYAYILSGAHIHTLGIALLSSGLGGSIIGGLFDTPYNRNDPSNLAGYTPVVGYVAGVMSSRDNLS
jgi:hypothetical protein